MLKEHPYFDKLKRQIDLYKKKLEADRISRHFSEHFLPIIAQEHDEIKNAQRIRHEVFCEELKLFDEQPKGFESDKYDPYSKQCLIKHQRTEEYAGTVRVIMPPTMHDPLPIETVATQYITKKEFLPSNFPRDQVCEVSRIAIPSNFRRRKSDNFDGAATGVINTETYSDIELRCFPLLAVGLYMTTAALCALEGKKHTFFMVEPKLARSMSYIGIKLLKIGGEFEYVGRRAPFYINNDDFALNLSPTFSSIMKSFTKKLSQQAYS